MKRDFDYVDMKDYEADTKEIAENAAAIIKKIQEEKDWLEMFFNLVIKAVGQVEIPESDIFTADKICIERTRSPKDGAIVFKYLENKND